MKPSEFYDNLLRSITDELERKVFFALTHRIGRLVTRAELIEAVFGLEVGTGAELAGSVRDRKIRVCIAKLRERSIPIVSSSGEAGYELCDDPDRINQYIAEEMHRVEAIQDKVTHLRRSLTTATSLREWRAEVGVPVQDRLL